MKTIKKIGRKVEGVGYDVAQGISRIKDRIGGDNSPRIGEDGSQHALEPIVTRIPTFAQGFDGKQPSDIHLICLPGSDMSMPAHPHPAGPAWWCGEEKCDYLAINVRDAKDLAVLDFDFHSASA